MEVPLCPQHREKNCERSELRFVEDTGTHYSFYCACCKLVWMVSKPNTIGAARYDNMVKRLQRINEIERANLHRKYFLPRRRVV